MNEETKAALLGSIKKWEDIAAGTGEDQGPKNCSLCLINSPNTFCKKCPVRIKVGRAFCLSTPYDLWITHINEKHQRHTGKAQCRTCRYLAKKEVLFLQSLLSEEQSTPSGDPKQSKGDNT
jgi:hypothetical protein